MDWLIGGIILAAFYGAFKIIKDIWEKKVANWKFIGIEVLLICLILFLGIFARNAQVESDNKKQSDLYKRLDSGTSHIDTSITGIRDYQRGQGSLAYFALYGLYDVGNGMHQSDMVLEFEGENLISNCYFEIYDVGRRINSPRYKLGDLMPKPKHPESLPLYKFPISDSDLKLQITFNSNSLDYTEFIRLVAIKQNMYTAYKVITWDCRYRTMVPPRTVLR